MSDFGVTIQNYTDLTQEEKDNASNNGHGKKYANYLRVTYNGETVILENDAVEPEDATLRRDFNWVVAAINTAFRLGRADQPSEQS